MQKKRPTGRFFYGPLSWLALSTGTVRCQSLTSVRASNDTDDGAASAISPTRFALAARPAGLAPDPALAGSGSAPPAPSPYCFTRWTSGRQSPCRLACRPIADRPERQTPCCSKRIIPLRSGIMKFIAVDGKVIQQVFGALGGIRTHDHRLRRAVLYPAELRAHWLNAVRRLGWHCGSAV
jgi:hypothetical protein